VGRSPWMKRIQDWHLDYYNYNRCRMTRMTVSRSGL
jgi:hypothetical protein